MLTAKTYHDAKATYSTYPGKMRTFSIEQPMRQQFPNRSLAMPHKRLNQCNPAV